MVPVAAGLSDMAESPLVQEPFRTTAMELISPPCLCSGLETLECHGPSPHERPRASYASACWPPQASHRALRQSHRRLGRDRRPRLGAYIAPPYGGVNARALSILRDARI